MLRPTTLCAALWLLFTACDDDAPAGADAVADVADQADVRRPDALPDHGFCPPVDAEPDVASDADLDDGTDGARDAEAVADATELDATSPDAAVPDAVSPDAVAPDAGPLVWVPRRILTEEDGLSGPDGLFTVGPSCVLVANEVGRQVLEIDVDALEVVVRVPAGGGLRAPEEVAVGPDGAIYVSDDSARAVFRVVDDEVERILSADDGLESPEGIAVGPDGSVYVADERARLIVRLDPEGVLTTLADEDDGVFAPEGLALGPDGTLYATDDRRGGVLAVDPEGVPRVFLGRDVLALPEAVAVAPSGDLWFTDNGGGAATLQRFTPAAEHQETVPMPVPAGQLAGIAVLPDGRLVVSVFRSREVHELWVVAREPMQ